MDDDQVPDQRPFLIAAYQSETEARAALDLRPIGTAVPGERPEDGVVAAQVVEMLDEPVEEDPEEAFLKAVSLSSDADFVKARRALFSYVDSLVTDQRSLADVTKTISALEGDYNEAVHQFTKDTRKRRAVTLLPKVGGGMLEFGGVPGGILAGKGVSTVVGRFVTAPEFANAPGQAFAMIRAAYRDHTPRSPRRSRRRWWEWWRRGVGGR